MKKFGLIVFAIVVAITTPSFAQETNKQSAENSLCSKVDAVIQNGDLNNAGGGTALLTDYYTDGNSLYGLGFISIGKDRSMIVIEIKENPTLIFAEPVSLTELKSYPTKIAAFLDKKSEIRPLQAATKSKQYEDVCNPLGSTIDGAIFTDKMDRKFLRHFFYGYRKGTGGTYCDRWGQVNQQLLFFQSYAPKIIKIKDKIFFVDEEFLGVTTPKDFKTNYVCGFDKILNGRVVPATVDDSSSIDTKSFLNSQGLDTKNIGINGHDKWFSEVLRNWYEGFALFK